MSPKRLLPAGGALKTNINGRAIKTKTISQCHIEKLPIVPPITVSPEMLVLACPAKNQSRIAPGGKFTPQNIDVNTETFDQTLQ